MSCMYYVDQFFSPNLELADRERIYYIFTYNSLNFCDIPYDASVTIFNKMSSACSLCIGYSVFRTRSYLAIGGN